MSGRGVRPRCIALGSLLLAAVVAWPGVAVSASRWSVVLTTAPQLPQDVWFSGMGNNVEGWLGGGSICLNQLAQGFPNGEQLTLLVEVVEGGIFGVDGSPVPPGTYTFPGIELPSFDYTVATNTTFYVNARVHVVQSKIPDFQVGDVLSFMFMWDHVPDRSIVHAVLWVDFGFGFVPFLNEGDLMANVHLLP